MGSRPLLYALIGALLTTGCAVDPDRYPSLAIRDIERTTGKFAVDIQRSETASPPSLSARPDVSQFIAKAQSAHTRFQAAQLGARKSVLNGRGQSADSLAYTNALLALAELSSLRSDTALALGDIDLMRSQAETDLMQADHIVAAQAEVMTMLTEQDAVMAQLWGSLDR